MSQLAAPISTETNLRATAAARPNVARDLITLTKPGIVRLVTITSAVGFVLALIVRGWNADQLVSVMTAALACIVGTALSAAGANTLNQCLEVRRDALMHRTRNRPIPAGRLTLAQGAAFGTILSIFGVEVLWVGANPIAAIVSLFTIVTYLFVYTPMKSITPLATWVGAVPGALPPMIGWAAASEGTWRGLDHPGGWTIFLIMFAWQIPHFLALAWKYREDYARGGYRVLSLNDHSGLATGWQSVIWTIIMIAFSLTPVWAIREHVGWAYAVSAVILGCGMLHLSMNLLGRRTDAHARNLFLGSVIYLPIVLFVLVGDAAWSLIR